MKKRSHHECPKSSKQPCRLKGILRLLLDLLETNPTSKYLVQKTGRDKRLVARDIKRLIEKGYIARIDRGVYKVIKTTRAIPQSHQEYYRIHNLEIELVMNESNYNQIKTTIIKERQYYNVRGAGNAGQYFDLEVTGLLTSSSIFLVYPTGWEIQCSNKIEIMESLYEIIKQTAMKWEQRFKVILFREGKINFNIRNIHIAYVNGELVEEFRKENITKLCISDLDDGKARFLIDMSKGFPELEMVHAKKAITDQDEVEFFGNTLRDKRYSALHIEHDDLKQIAAQTSMMLQLLLKPLNQEKVDDKPSEDDLKSFRSYTG